MALGMLITGHKPKKWGWSWYFESGKDWGGADWGLFFVTNKNSPDELKNHEFGHAIQNCIFGPFMLFLVNLPSTVRYWTRRLSLKRGKKLKTQYDDIWFERQATRLGTEKMRDIKKLGKSQQKYKNRRVNSNKIDN